MTLNFEEALETVRHKVEALRLLPEIETVSLDQARGRVLAEDVSADRDYPPFHRSIRDGFAVCSADLRNLPVTLRRIGEVRAGQHFTKVVARGECVQIMTGAPVPEGTDAVVMVEHVSVADDRVEFYRQVKAGDNIVQRGAEAAVGTRVVARGSRIGAGEVALLASVGAVRVTVYRRPCAGILPTGDEVVPAETAPQWFQIRNSNATALATQVASAGGFPLQLGIAPDRPEPLREMIERGLGSCDLLLISGGVSAGKYDLVEQVLAGLDAEIYFDGVGLRPGKPLVFGRVRNKFFFGLPGNPVSTYVTFELFARPALAALEGATFEAPVFLRARLGEALRSSRGLTAFLPARVTVEGRDPVVRTVPWQGSGDLVSLASANCFLVVHTEQRDVAEGDWVDVLPKPV